MHLTYKIVTPYIKRKQNNFFGIFEILASSHDFNKLVIKAKMHAKTFIFFFMKIQYDFFIIFLERLGRMHENKIFFIYLFIFTKIRYFNTGFVSLQYKNTN